MSQIKELTPRPGITLLAVKVPEGATNIRLETDGDKYIMFFNQGKQMGVRLLHSGFYYELLGMATEIPEEVWQKLIEPRWDYYKNYLAPEDGNVGNYKRLVCNTATEAAISFLEANEVDPNSVLLLAIADLD